MEHLLQKELELAKNTGGKFSLAEIDSVQILQKFTAPLQWRGQSLALIGPIGAGKTWLVKQIISQWGVEPKKILSPTFVYCHMYDLAGLQVHHYDLYRVQDEEHLIEIGLWESLQNNHCFTLIEWADRFPNVHKMCTAGVHISPDHHFSWVAPPSSSSSSTQ